jgi:hypothetical protein
LVPLEEAAAWSGLWSRVLLLTLVAPSRALVPKAWTRVVLTLAARAAWSQ